MHPQYLTVWSSRCSFANDLICVYRCSGNRIIFWCMVKDRFPVIQGNYLPSWFEVASGNSCYVSPWSDFYFRRLRGTNANILCRSTRLFTWAKGEIWRFEFFVEPKNYFALKLSCIFRVLVWWSISQWLEGPDSLPPKFQAILPLNNLMAHTPWIVNTTHIAKLVKVHLHSSFISFRNMHSLQSGVDGWSVQDLVHAIVILAHFHSLCGFVFGCAVNPEPDSDYGVTWGLCRKSVPRGSVFPVKFIVSIYAPLSLNTYKQQKLVSSPKKQRPPPVRRKRRPEKNSSTKSRQTCWIYWTSQWLMRSAMIPVVNCPSLVI